MYQASIGPVLRGPVSGAVQCYPVLSGAVQRRSSCIRVEASSGEKLARQDPQRMHRAPIEISRQDLIDERTERR